MSVLGVLGVSYLPRYNANDESVNTINSRIEMRTNLELKVLN